ncbi:Flp family type IVb pilin [Vampirovibrio chlorellavorus]|uniref:Flp family type IVb pilin n=1 Tax=Vampirovibrio chlorellavorus TaxID=758823 RepID=UPI0026EFCF50|nr:hypothetical protein [Vampirovibrio chlorellavorus]
MLKDCFITRWVDNARIHRMGFSKRAAGLGSTATEMGLIGAVVLVASLAFLFFLGEALQYAFSFVRKDMVTQVATANGLSPEAFVAQWKGGQPGQSEGILNPVQPTAPVVTAGSNGNEAHAEIYKALQELIDRSLQKGTMTEAQADLLSKLVKELIISYGLEFANDKAYDAYGEACMEVYGEDYMKRWDAEEAYWEAYERSDGSFESAEAAYRSVLSMGNDPSDAGLDELYATTASNYTEYIKSEMAIYDHPDIILTELLWAADEMGLLNKPDVNDLLNKVSLEAYKDNNTVG